MNKTYVLVTAAYNEEKFIEKTIQSVIVQTRLPKKWIIVSDGSTDGTDEIVNRYASRHSFIELLRITEKHKRNFGAQVDAIRAGYNKLKQLPFDFFSNVDADISLPPNYYETLMAKMEEDPRLALAGGFIYENYGNGFQNRSSNSSQSVAHATQFFRRACFEEIGGYLPLKYGGPDWVAEVMLRQRGWRVEAFSELAVNHYRPAASEGGHLRGWYRQGMMDYSLGSLPSFEIVKCLRRLPGRPFVIGAMARLTAFAYSYIIRAPRLVPDDFVCYLRSEQRQRLREFVGLKAQQPQAAFRTSQDL